MKRLLLAALFVALLAGGYYCSDTFSQFLFGPKALEQKGPRPAPAQAVIGDASEETAAPIQVSAIGSVHSIATVVIKSRVDGQIDEVNFEEGQDVKEGDLLFTLDNRAFEAQLRQAQALLERDRAQLERADLELRRQTDLASRGASPQQKLEDAQMAQ
jgi:multidrug efflux system membrane fusion protein